MMAKKLNWEKVKHEIFEEFSYKAFISVLKLNGNPAYYQVSKVNDNIQCSFWCHNSAVVICNYCKNIELAIDECQKHYERIVSENCSLSHNQEAIADCVCAELLISKHEVQYKKVFNAVGIGMQKTSNNKRS